ncbi:MAG: HlyD family efflux transporter periplasmic adaptor subunit, partial [Proteobacteria bacterium]
SKVWVLADVYEQDLPFVEKGQPVVVRVLAFPERTFDGVLGYVSQVLDQSTRSATARVELDNASGILKPGMMARVEARGISRGTITVPTSALLARRDQFFAFVKREDGSFEEREVTVAEQHGQHTTLLTGLRLGEEVVVEGAILLDAEANEAL